MVANISIIVPVFNGAAHIDECLKSLCHLDYPDDKLEIIVVDNNSTDGTRAIIDGHPVIRLDEKIQGAAAARNAGVTASKFDIIGFTDADCVVDRNWAREIDKAFENDSVDAVMGFAGGINATLFAEIAQKRWENFWFRETEHGFELNRSGVDTRNCAIRRQILLEIGGFDSSLLHCEDLELSMRLNRANCRIVGVPAMRVSHHNPATVDVSLRKARERSATIREIRRRCPDEEALSDFPMPSSAFLGVAELNLSGTSLALVIRILGALSRVTLLLFRILLALRWRGYPTSKMYRVYHGIGYDRAILRERRRKELNDHECRTR